MVLLEWQAFSLENDFVPPVFLHSNLCCTEVDTKLFLCSARSCFKFSSGSRDAINIHFDQFKNMVAFTKSSVWGDFDCSTLLVLKIGMSAFEIWSSSTQIFLITRKILINKQF